MSSYFRVGSIALTLLLPVFMLAFTSPLSMNAQAADACSGDTTPVQWNQTAQRLSLVPFYNGMWWGSDFYEDMYYEEEGKDSNPRTSDAVEPAYNPALSPEESWMYESYFLPRLDPLEENHFTSMLIGNDSVGALRVNLSENYRTTICITLQDTELNPVDGDVYLFTTQEYENYVQSYHASHDQNWWYGEEVDETLSDIPPEWRSFNFLGWKSYRDSHEYEKTSEVNFALNLDGPEVYTSLFSGADWQDFYIVIDTWDNVHDFDAESPNAIVAADVTIITTERSLILPPFTVALVFFAVFLTTLIIPFVLNAKYMKAGLSVEMPVESIVPSLDTQPDEQYLSRKELQQPVPLPEPVSGIETTVEPEENPAPSGEI
ncbi:MAG: hypothetical protein CMA09_02725 [Euryarchaeota archaeon]|nr:hypothetical protein [Euryarchaeota archaeon]